MIDAAVKNKVIPNLFNINHQPFIDNPYPYYDKARQINPIYVTPEYTFLFKHKDVKQLLLSKKTIKDYWGPINKTYNNKGELHTGFNLASRWLLFRNVPAHKEIRQLFAAALSYKKINSLQETCNLTANKLIDTFIKNRTVDLAHDYACKLPLAIISKLLGIPEEDQTYIFNKLSILLTTIDAVFLPPDKLQQLDKAATELQDYIGRIVTKRANSDNNDLISLLLKIRKREKSNVSNDDLISNIIIL
jgi:cytochrome P450